MHSRSLMVVDPRIPRGGVRAHLKADDFAFQVKHKWKSKDTTRKEIAKAVGSSLVEYYQSDHKYMVYI